eukprot:1154520-Pelagomonas_calceolata.AAC.7
MHMEQEEGEQKINCNTKEGQRAWPQGDVHTGGRQASICPQEGCAHTLQGRTPSIHFRKETGTPLSNAVAGQRCLSHKVGQTSPKGTLLARKHPQSPQFTP